MNTFLKIVTIAISIGALVGCTRIETGEVGVRVHFNKQIDTQELMPGTINQTIIGDVLTFQTKDVAAEVNDLTPLAADNSTVADFDMTVVYSINPQYVAELYIDKNRSFHSQNDSGDTLLMYNYIIQLARNAAYKEVRKYKSLNLTDNRTIMEQNILNTIRESLASEHLNNAITIQQILIRNIAPAPSIVQSANLLVQAENEQKRKEVEVKTAQLEAERIAALNANAGATEYMAAMALVNISEAIKDGKVNTIVVPYDFKGIVDTRKSK